jgi:hypothetical protein
MELSRVKGTWDQVKIALPDVLNTYEVDIEKAEGYLTFKGKTGAQALKEQTAWQAYYLMRRTEVSKLLKYMDSQVESCRGRLHKKYAENYSRALGERVTDKYINNEPEYLSYLELYLEVEEIRDKLSAICDAFTSRGFSLRDWTVLKVAQLQDDLI